MDEPADFVAVPLNDLTDRQLTIYHIHLLRQQTVILNRLDTFMADLTQSVASLQAAVDNVAVRFASQLVPLTEALSSAQAALAEAAAQDIAQNAALAEAVAQAQTHVDNAAAAAGAIDAEVAELNLIGAAPDVPVEPVPVEELPPPPSEETPA